MKRITENWRKFLKEEAEEKTTNISELSDEDLQYLLTKHRFNPDHPEAKEAQKEATARFQKALAAATPETGWTLSSSDDKTQGHDQLPGDSRLDEEERYIEQRFNKSMSMAKFDAELERYEVKFNVDFPDSIKNIESVLYAANKGLANALRRIYPDYFD